MSLPLIHLFTFSNPYKIYKFERLRIDEILNGNFSEEEKIFGKKQLEKTIFTPVDAAMHILDVGADNTIDHYIEKNVSETKEFRHWRNTMPSKIPAHIQRYQNIYSSVDLNQVTKEIDQIGCIPPENQVLFHGGNILNVTNLYKSTKLSRPLSTTFCPQVALRDAEHLGKIYDSGVVYLYVLTVIKPKTNIYVYRHKSRNNLSKEKEVLFSAGASICITRIRKMSSNYECSKYDNYGRRLSKLVPAYVVEATIS
ncbi:hypothetical protein [Acinetobacter bereziniae]|uniref:hypothetical protein n=1 Tax=Acinetobacter bereziniae TaxID=106648 RepID=UPI002953CCD1|nr:hypothetical protein [Acinetobacter bereziniae]MDV8155631.1 hypothetical protein [Acinetobacter bereziniae]